MTTCAVTGGGSAISRTPVAFWCAPTGTSPGGRRSCRMTRPLSCVGFYEKCWRCAIRHPEESITMPLHRLSSVTIGVPNVAETAAYYTEFGLTPQLDGWFGTRDGGRQLRIVHAPTRRLVELHVGADDSDDLARVADALHRLGIKSARGPHSVTAIEKATGVQATVEVSPRVTQAPARAVVYNGPGRIERTGARAPGVLRTERVQPRKLGHTVLGTTDLAITRAFFLEGLGFKLSDAIKDVGTFMRCSTDHHNVLVLQAPVAFLHHTSWQVDDVDEVGRGASAMLTDH